MPFAGDRAKAKRALWTLFNYGSVFLIKKASITLSMYVQLNEDADDVVLRYSVPPNAEKQFEISIFSVILWVLILFGFLFLSRDVATALRLEYTYDVEAKGQRWAPLEKKVVSKRVPAAYIKANVIETRVPDSHISLLRTFARVFVRCLPSTFKEYLSHTSCAWLTDIEEKDEEDDEEKKEGGEDEEDDGDYEEKLRLIPDIGAGSTLLFAFPEVEEVADSSDEDVEDKKVCCRCCLDKEDLKRCCLVRRFCHGVPDSSLKALCLCCGWSCLWSFLCCCCFGKTTKEAPKLEEDNDDEDVDERRLKRGQSRLSVEVTYDNGGYGK